MRILIDGCIWRLQATATGQAISWGATLSARWHGCPMPLLRDSGYARRAAAHQSPAPAACRSLAIRRSAAALLAPAPCVLLAEVTPALAACPGGCGFSLHSRAVPAGPPAPPRCGASAPDGLPAFESSPERLEAGHELPAASHIAAAPALPHAQSHRLLSGTA